MEILTAEFKLKGAEITIHDPVIRYKLLAFFVNKAQAILSCERSASLAIKTSCYLTMKGVYHDCCYALKKVN